MSAPTAPALQIIILLAAALVIVSSLCVVLANLFSGDPDDLDIRAEAHRPKSQFPK